MQREKVIQSRKKGKLLKVFGFPQGDDTVPAIRVAGHWLNSFGFDYDDRVLLKARKGKILITKVKIEPDDKPT